MNQHAVSFPRINRIWLAGLLLLGLMFTAPSRALGQAPIQQPAALGSASATTLTLEDEQSFDLDALIARLDAMPDVRQVNMYASKLTPQQMDVLSSRYPNITFGWTLHIGDHTLRTDATAFSTLHSRKSEQHTSADFEVLKYCKNLLALDIGHNAVTDIRFLESLPGLKILILGRNRLTDIAPLGTLHQLEYLELFSDGVKDITALQTCTNLLDLNLTNNAIADLSPILHLPHLQRLWLFRSTGILPYDRFPKDVRQAITAELPEGCTVNFTASGTGGGWREHPRYNTIYRVFQTGVYTPWED
ncbi:MAG: leucine-rich repeat domain-containing protein [Candidatus Limiplasma sp.]|nr:leucine-rich repeat domain-containing protein [Candidatus Limiplasma sp.]